MKILSSRFTCRYAFLAILTSTFFSCSIFSTPSVLDATENSREDIINTVDLGMSSEEILLALGEPDSRDELNPTRWYYGINKKERLIIEFDEDALSRVEIDSLLPNREDAKPTPAKTSISDADTGSSTIDPPEPSETVEEAPIIEQSTVDPSNDEQEDFRESISEEMSDVSDVDLAPSVLPPLAPIPIGVFVAEQEDTADHNKTADIQPDVQAESLDITDVEESSISTSAAVPITAAAAEKSLMDRSSDIELEDAHEPISVEISDTVSVDLEPSVSLPLAPIPIEVFVAQTESAEPEDIEQDVEQIPEKLDVSEPVEQAAELAVPITATQPKEDVVDLTLATETLPQALNDEEEIEHRVETWKTAWAAQEVDRYIAQYIPDYSPEADVSHASWVKQRQEKLSQPEFIRITLDNMIVNKNDDSSYLVQFVQYFESDRYKDAVVKVLTLTRVDGKWLIAKEHSIEMSPGDSDLPENNIAEADRPDADRAIRDQLTTWQQAWSSKNTEIYLGHYIPNYRPDKKISHADWRKQTEEQFSHHPFIEIKLDDIQIQKDSTHQYTVQFTQSFRTDTYRETVVKALVFKKWDQTWLIAEEEIVETISWFTIRK